MTRMLSFWVSFWVSFCFLDHFNDTKKVNAIILYITYIIDSDIDADVGSIML